MNRVTFPQVPTGGLAVRGEFPRSPMWAARKQQEIISSYIYIREWRPGELPGGGLQLLPYTLIL